MVPVRDRAHEFSIRAPQQRFHFTAQFRVLRTRCVEVRRPIAEILGQCGVIERFNLRPALRVHWYLLEPSTSSNRGARISLPPTVPGVTFSSTSRASSALPSSAQRPPAPPASEVESGHPYLLRSWRWGQSIGSL